MTDRDELADLDDQFGNPGGTVDSLYRSAVWPAESFLVSSSSTSPRAHGADHCLTRYAKSYPIA